MRTAETKTPITKEIAVVQVTAEKISVLTGFPVEAIAVIKNTVAKNTTDTELAYFLSVAKSVNLNPLNKEIWCYKDNKGNLLVFAGRDGFLKRAQESPNWNGMTSFEVCFNDFFEIELTVGKASIVHRPNFKDRGKIIGAYAIVHPKGCNLPTIEWAEFSAYDKGWNVWKDNPAAMIKKVAEAHVLKKAFGITILQAEYDYEVKDEIVSAVDHAPKTDLEIASKKIVDALDDYKGEDKETLKTMCAEKQQAGELTVEILQNVGKQIGLAL